MTTVRATLPTTVLPQELIELLLELALALQRYGMYPGGHPSVDTSIQRVAERLARVHARQPLLSLGVARRQLIVEGVATDPMHPVLRSLAERLHRHRLGAVVLRAGIDTAELRSAIRAISQDAERTGEPLGSATAERLIAWPHVGFYRVTYEQLQLTEGDEASGGEGTAAAQLWLGLAQAALAQEGGATTAAVDTDPDTVARAINEQPAAHAYDQMIVGYMLQLADELRQDRSTAVSVRRRLSHMLRNLEPATLQRLLAMGGDDVQRMRFLRDATDSLRPEAVLDVVHAAAHAQGQDISTSMLRLLRKLAAFADSDTGSMTDRAEEQLREQVRDLLDGWSLRDPNPDRYTRKLDLMARETVADVEAAARYGVEPLRVVQMAVEVSATGTTFWRALDTIIDEGQLHELLEILDSADTHNVTVDLVWRRLETADHIRHILTTDPVDFESLDRLFARMPYATVISLLLDRISESVSRGTRMGVYQRLRGYGHAAVPQIIERLRDERWFVLRNMLALLGEIGSWPETFSPLSYARLDEAAVRREALELAIRTPREREQAIALALLDRDERAVRIGSSAAREHGLPAAALPIVLQRITDASLSAQARAALIRLLPDNGAPQLVEILSNIVIGRGLLGKVKLVEKSPAMLAALSVLARSDTHDARVRTALELARAATDPDIRKAVAVGESPS